MPQYSSEYVLQLLQRFLKHQNQVKQIHCLLITDSHLLNNTSSPSNPKWKCTLFYNTLIRAHFGFGQSHDTLHFFTSMLQHNVPPNSHTFPCLFRAASSSPSLASSVGSSLHTQIIRRGVSCDPFIQTSLLCLYSDIGGIINARKVFDEIAFPCVVEFNAMLDALGKNGDMGSAVFLFETMRKRDVVSWTSVINGFVRNGHFGEAIQFFEKMIWHADVKDCLAKPNEATYVSVLSSCAKLDNAGASYFGKQMHGYIIRNEVALTVFMGTALIDLYGKSGLLETAIKVFEQMVVKEVCTWNAIISSLACNSRENQALEMFERMKSNGLRPNEITFVSVLTACARAKLVELGLELFQSMFSEFAVVPVMEHYGCVVDILGRAGLLREARVFISRMPFEPDASVWGALLGACKIHGAAMLGNDVGKRMLKLQRLHCGQYVALSHINAGAERWVHASDLRQAMAKSGIKKIPAYSSINSL